MPPLFTINACKTFGCRNLGLATSPDYFWPDYRLGYPALHCKACGSYPPLFNDAEFRCWAATYMAQYAKEHGHFCPNCFQSEVIRYGHNPKGTQRLQCQSCKKVWTPKQQSRQTASSPEAICSIPFITPFQGAYAGQSLYCLLSFDAINGNVLHVSSNFSPFPAGASLHYRWKGVNPVAVEHDNIVQRITMKERQFLQRSQFDEIQYGAASLKRNARGALLRPVITAHGHFRILKTRFPEVSTHIVAHECFLRGAIITAWSERFRHRQASLWFVEEEIRDIDSVAPWLLRGKTYQGWWQNQWQLWEQGGNRKMVCSLTDTPKKNGATISLATSRHFVAWLQQQPLFQKSAQFSAGHITQIITALATQYSPLQD